MYVEKQYMSFRHPLEVLEPITPLDKGDYCIQKHVTMTSTIYRHLII